MEKRKGFINNNYKGKVFAGLAALTIAASAFSLSTCTNETKIEPPILEEIEEIEEIDEVNDFEAIKERLVNFVENAGLRGLNNLEVEGVLALYMLLNIEEMSPYQAYYLYYGSLRDEAAIDKAIQMMNTVASDALYSKPGEMIDVASLIVNPESQVELIKIQELIAHYNVASESEKLDVAGVLIKEIEDLYASDQWEKLPGGVSLLILSKIWFIYHTLANDQIIVAQYGNELKALELILFIDQTNSRYSDNSYQAREYFIVEYIVMKAEIEKLILQGKGGFESLSRYKELVASVTAKAKINYVPRGTSSYIEKEPVMGIKVETINPIKPPTSFINEEPMTKKEISQANRESVLYNRGLVDGTVGKRDALNDVFGSGLLSTDPFPSKTFGGYDPKYENDPAYMRGFREEYSKQYSTAMQNCAYEIGHVEGEIYAAKLVQLKEPYEKIQTITSPLYTKFNGHDLFAISYLNGFHWAVQDNYYYECSPCHEETEKEHCNSAIIETGLELDENNRIVAISDTFGINQDFYIHFDNNGPFENDRVTFQLIDTNNDQILAQEIYDVEAEDHHLYSLVFFSSPGLYRIVALVGDQIRATREVIIEK